MIDDTDVLNELDDYSLTLQGVAGLINDMQYSNDEGEYIYSKMRFLVLENVLFDVIQNMKKLYTQIDAQRSA